MEGEATKSSYLIYAPLILLDIFYAWSKYIFITVIIWNN